MPSRLARLIATAVSAAALLAPVGAQAMEKVTVFSFEGFDLPKSVEMAPFGLATLVARKLELAGHEVVEPSLTIRDMVVALGCASIDQDCANKIAGHLEVSMIVVGKLEGPGKVRARIRIFRTDGSRFREVDAELPADVSKLTAEFARVADLVVVMSSKEATPREGPDTVGGAGVIPGTTASAPKPKKAKKAKKPLPAGMLAGFGVVALGAGLVAVSAVMGARYAGARGDYRAGIEPWTDADGVPVLETTEAFSGERNLCSDGPERLATEAGSALEKAGVFDACDKMRRSAVVAWVTGVAAAALLGTGVALVVTGKRPATSDASDDTVRVTPEIGPTRIGATVTVSF